MANVGVIGAGVSGLYAAWLLRGAGHTVTVLEAKPRAGGLSSTVRRGDVIVEVDERGSVTHQTVGIDNGLYINAGPGRFPHHHRRILALCQVLGVDLEPYLMSSDANYYVDARSGERFRRRRIDNDARGWLAERAYDDADPNRRRRELIEAFGDLRSGKYVGTPRAGDGEPVSLDRLAKLRYWENRYNQPISHLWQDVMFQPTGGMDQLWQALLARVGEDVVYNAPVERITNGHHGIEVGWRRHGQAELRLFDWVLSSVPFPTLATLGLGGFDRAWREAAVVPGFAPACKVGWQSETRWWETDTEQIYGGISYTNDAIQQFWYPSVGQFEAGPATLTGAYAAYEAAWRLGKLSPARRIERARRGGSMIHPEVANRDLVPTSKAVTVAWHLVPYQAGGWCHWDPADPDHEQAFTTLTQPCKRFVAIGDQISSCPGWHEGCLESVDRAMAAIDGQPGDVGAAAPQAVPDSRRLTVGDQPTGDVVYEQGDPQW